MGKKEEKRKETGNVWKTPA